MSARRTVREIVEGTVLGPWPDHSVLNPRSPLATQEPHLSDVDFFCDGRPTGLDESELFGDEVENQDAHQVYFYGVLEIDHPWRDLSEAGIDLVQSQLQERVPGLIISNLPRGCTLRVGILGKKSMTVTFLMSGEKVPNGLCLTTLVDFEDPGAADGIPSLPPHFRKRQYEIVSMGAVTYSLSRTYLMRRHFRRILEDIVDKETPPAPLRQRDMQYFLDRYEPQPAEQIRCRLLHRDPVEDSDLDTDEEAPAGKLRDTRKRMPRHKSRAETFAFFAMHAKWALEDQAKIRMSETRLFDLEGWQRGWKQLKKLKERAKRSGLKWGVDPTRDEESSEDEEIQIRPSTSRRRERPRLVELPDAPAADIGVDYDSDMSLSSVPAYSSSDEDRDPHPPIDPELLKLLPRWDVSHCPPEWADDRRWYCPQRQCGYRFRLPHLADAEREALAALDPHLLQIVDEKMWRWGDPEIRRVLERLVDVHWEAHLHALGIEKYTVTGRRGNKTWVRFRWLDPAAHRPWPPPGSDEEGDQMEVDEFDDMYAD